jgi:hypothetical protein
MKKVTFVLAVFPLIMALFMGGCSDPIGPEIEIVSGEGLLVISLVDANVGAGPALTMLPADPQFTRYELVYVGGPFDSAVISFYNSAFQLPVVEGTYQLYVLGYSDDKVVARSERQSVGVSASSISYASFTLKPYMDTEPGVLDFSLGWDGLARMPWRAELLIEQYAGVDGVLIDPPTPLPPSFIPPEYRAGSTEGSILLLDRDSAFENLTGALTLPPGEYQVTISVTMDPGTTPASRLDFAYIYSNLTTTAPFYYGGGDLYISSTSPDSGAGFITGFTFEQTPNATTVIGSEPALDGTRMIMVMVPNSTNLTELTPVVAATEGAVITSPLPAMGGASYSQMDFTGPMIWTAQAKNGGVQKYTVVVSKAPNNSSDKMITNFFFKEHPDVPGTINQDTGVITVALPYGSPKNPLTPIVTIIGKSVVDNAANTSPDGSDTAKFDFTGSRGFTVTAENDSTKGYDVTVTVAGNTVADITRFAVDGYPERAVTAGTNAITGFGNIGSAPDSGYYPITLRLPYGVSLKNLTPLIQYQGKDLSPLSGLQQNFSGPVEYTVTPDTGSGKIYKVTVTNDEPDKNTGIFDFRVTNVPAAKVVIWQKPRQDGKIPIVIQAPYGTDEENIIAAITLSSSTSTISPGSGQINFGSPNYQEAVYTVTSQGGAAAQDYVVVVSEGPQYYYVDGVNGNDAWPDIYNGGSESHPFKTLAYAVKQAGDTANNISRIFIKSDLTAATEAGTSAVKDPSSAFTLDLGGAANKKLTITSTAGATLKGTSGKRVLTITGGTAAHGLDFTFENINITGGSTTANGGGIYITGNHNKVTFSGGNITGNTASSGGGVFIEDDTNGKTSEFTFMGGEISGNTAAGAASGNPDVSAMGGGGGVYVKGDAGFWLAGGIISGNTAKGAGGGVLVNGNKIGTGETGFIMSGGRIVKNTSTSQTYPHGGGGVYVARGAFKMMDGEITGNTANQQGGGVFVHWGDARFIASGNSTITGNDGAGSSKAICNRGVTEMRENARADRVYVWDYDEAPAQKFTLAGNARITGIVLAYSALNRNVIEIADSFENSGVICTIDLESHSNSGDTPAEQPEPDWIGKKIITGSNAVLKKVLGIDPSGTSRLPLNSFTGTPSVYNLETNYKIDVAGDNTYGTFKKR